MDGERVNVLRARFVAKTLDELFRWDGFLSGNEHDFEEEFDVAFAIVANEILRQNRNFGIKFGRDGKRLRQNGFVRRGDNHQHHLVFGEFGLDFAEDGQDDEDNKRRDNGDEEVERTAGDADGHDDPNRACRRQTFGAVIAMDDGASAQETDAGDDLGCQTRDVPLLTEHRGEAINRNDHDDARANADEQVGTQTCVSAAPFALNADCSAQKDGKENGNQDEHQIANRPSIDLPII